MKVLKRSYVQAEASQGGGLGNTHYRTTNNVPHLGTFIFYHDAKAGNMFWTTHQRCYLQHHRGKPSKTNKFDSRVLWFFNPELCVKVQ